MKVATGLTITRERGTWTSAWQQQERQTRQAAGGGREAGTRGESLHMARTSWRCARSLGTSASGAPRRRIISAMAPMYSGMS